MTKRNLLADDIEKAIQLHRDLAYARNISLGPKWEFHPGSEASGVRTALQIEELLQPYAPNASQEIHLPSVWHAALFCSYLQHIAVTRGDPHLMFRGQSNREWEIISSLHRPGVEVALEQKRAEVFARLLRSFSFNTMMLFHPATQSRVYLRMGPAAHTASAQHYGIKTALIDFTTDADVAAWFASGKCEGGAREASIDILPLKKSTLARSHLVLPPPFIERLYLQRGTFLKANHAKSLTKLETIKLVFPNPNEDHFSNYSTRFDVLRGKAQPVNILPPETLFEPLKLVTEDIVSGRIVPKTQDDYDDIVRKLKQKFMFIYSNPELYWSKYVDHFEDVLHQLVYSFPDYADIHIVDIDVLEEIVGVNPEIVGSIIALYELWFAAHPERFPEEQISFLRQIMDEMQSRLRAVGYSQKMEEESYYQFLTRHM